MVRAIFCMKIQSKNSMTEECPKWSKQAFHSSKNALQNDL